MSSISFEMSHLIAQKCRPKYKNAKGFESTHHT